MTNIVKTPHTKNDQKFQEHIGHLDRATANQGMRALADKYGFPVTDIDGTLYTSSGWVQMLFEYSSDRAFRKLLRSHDIRPIRLLDVARNKKSRRKIADDLGLSPKDNESLLLDFITLLKAARFSKTPAARKLMDYVFAQERWARLEQAVQRETGLSIAQLRAQHRQVEGCPVRVLRVQGLGLAVSALPSYGDRICVSALQRALDVRQGRVRDWRRYDDDLWADYDTVAGRDLAAMKATGWISRSASHVAVVSLPVGQRIARKAGTPTGRLVADGIGRLLADAGRLALPGGR